MTAHAVAGVRVRRLPQIIYYDATGYEDLSVNDFVIVDTDRCREAARVVIAPRQLQTPPVNTPLPQILRRANAFDLSQWQQLKIHEPEALAECKGQVIKHSLAMRLLSAEYNFDGSHITFYFVADGRVDFRALVRDLAVLFPARVELWQIGPRDRAKLIGGLAPCGRELCCGKFLEDFPKASIKMAKDQDMPLGPNAATGVCGRPMCCLAFEQEVYQEAKPRVPRVGEIVTTARGSGRVIARNILKDCVTVQFEDGATVTVCAGEVQRTGRGGANGVSDAAAHVGGAGSSDPGDKEQEADG
ncbi:MAG: stage 0 sporulation protein [Chloroflexi bacterium]|nr:stage 0 sporulation protein [Chloroflexota bacterium]MCL5951636.1 stage 0 sporulation protein [Chloroflexota bacterium]